MAVPFGQAGRASVNPPDLHSMPPPLMTSEPGSFARHTIVERKPQLIRQVIADNDYPPDVVAALDALRTEIAQHPSGCSPSRPPTRLSGTARWPPIGARPGWSCPGTWPKPTSIGACWKRCATWRPAPGRGTTLWPAQAPGGAGGSGLVLRRLGTAQRHRAGPVL